MNKYIFETIYHAALERSNEIAKERLVGMREIKSSRMPRDPDLGDRRGLGFETEYIKNLISLYEPINEELNNLSDNHLGAYSSFEGSPASKGILQFDMWRVDPTKHGRYDWSELKESIKQYGLRNSLLLAPMPTASTSQILGNNECFEPFTSNIYSRRTLAGDFVIPNKYLMNELSALGLWNEEIKDK